MIQQHLYPQTKHKKKTDIIYFDPRTKPTNRTDKITNKKTKQHQKSQRIIHRNYASKISKKHRQRAKKPKKHRQRKPKKKKETNKPKEPLTQNNTPLQYNFINNSNKFTQQHKTNITRTTQENDVIPNDRILPLQKTNDNYRKNQEIIPKRIRHRQNRYEI